LYLFFEVFVAIILISYVKFLCLMLYFSCLLRIPGIRSTLAVR